MSIMKIEAVPYEVTDTPLGKEGPSSAYEPNPGTKFRFRECPKHYEVVDPKSEIGDVIARNHSWDSKIPRSESTFPIWPARLS